MNNNSISNKKWRHNNPEATRAHWILAWEVKQGRITPQPCEVCGKLNTGGHHDDYSKPLEVRWLCPYHHRKLHAPQEAKQYIKKGHIYPKHTSLQDAISLRSEGKTYKEIGVTLGVSKGTAYKWLNPGKRYRQS